MSTERELQEAAAKAAGMEVKYMPAKPGVRAMFWHTNVGEWNPLTDDGDAFRLAVALRVDIVQFSSYVRVDVAGLSDTYEKHGDDPAAATRRAIVRAAAAMART